jgi:hypothetical protein
MGYFQDVRTCSEHGFVLSPEGTCVRCIRDAARAARRARVAKLAFGGLFAVTLLGVGAAWARAHRSDEPRPAPPPQVVAAAPIPASTPEPPLAAAAPADHSALDAWEAELARADAVRKAEAAAKAAAEQQQIRAALELPSTPAPETPRPTRRTVRADNLRSSVDHPSWWQDTSPAWRPGVGTIAQQQRAMANAGVAPSDVTNPGAWLPPNNGGNFTTRSH